MGKRLTRFITVFADASYCPDTGAAGFGGWAKFGDPVQTARYSGRLAGCNNSTDAETMAIEATLHLLQREDVTFKQAIMVIQSDCVAALDRIKRTHHKALMGLGLQYIKYKHVRGHQPNNDPRSYVNNFCDQRARKHMRLMREDLRTING